MMFFAIRKTISSWIKLSYLLCFFFFAKWAQEKQYQSNWDIGTIIYVWYRFTICFPHPSAPQTKCSGCHFLFNPSMHFPLIAFLHFGQITSSCCCCLCAIPNFCLFYNKKIYFSSISSSMDSGYRQNQDRR